MEEGCTHASTVWGHRWHVPWRAPKDLIWWPVGSWCFYTALCIDTAYSLPGLTFHPVAAPPPAPLTPPNYSVPRVSPRLLGCCLQTLPSESPRDFGQHLTKTAPRTSSTFSPKLSYLELIKFLVICKLMFFINVEVLPAIYFSQKFFLSLYSFPSEIAITHMFNT